MSLAVPARRAYRRLSADDDVVWAHFARQITVLPGRPSPAPPPAARPSNGSAPIAVSVPTRATPPAARTSKNPVSIGASPGGVDKASWQRFRTGKLAATRTLDLHGRTAQRAFHALTSFLRTAQAEGVRCVEIITGRGTGEAGGVLKRELPHWLNLPELRPLILGAAHPHAANQGSVRLLLRRLR